MYIKIIYIFCKIINFKPFIIVKIFVFLKILNNSIEMAFQPLTGINQQPLVFAQIRNGSSSPEVIRARIVSSSRIINIKSNMFLHLFYSKPYQRDQGYNHAVDQAYSFQV